jgi:hypothetical protein
LQDFQILLRDPTLNILHLSVNTVANIWQEKQREQSQHNNTKALENVLMR